METLCYLAMTPEEFTQNLPPPWKSACFYAGQQEALGEMLIVTDPMLEPDLLSRLEGLRFRYLLLDLELPPSPASRELLERLSRCYEDRCIFPAQYGFDGFPLFLPPVPPQAPPEEYLAPWKGRAIWLDVTPNRVTAEVGEQGTSFSPAENALPLPCCDDTLCCHYRMENEPRRAVFTLGRTPEDTARLLERGRSYGVRGCVGLLGEWLPKEKV